MDNTNTKTSQYRRCKVNKWLNNEGNDFYSKDNINIETANEDNFQSNESDESTEFFSVSQRMTTNNNNNDDVDDDDTDKSNYADNQKLFDMISKNKKKVYESLVKPTKKQLKRRQLPQLFGSKTKQKREKSKSIINLQKFVYSIEESDKNNASNFETSDKTEANEEIACSENNITVSHYLSPVETSYEMPPSSLFSRSSSDTNWSESKSINLKYSFVKKKKTNTKLNLRKVYNHNSSNKNTYNKTRRLCEQSVSSGKEMNDNDTEENSFLKNSYDQVVKQKKILFSNSRKDKYIFKASSLNQANEIYNKYKEVKKQLSQSSSVKSEINKNSPKQKIKDNENEMIPTDIIEQKNMNSTNNQVVETFDQVENLIMPRDVDMDVNGNIIESDIIEDLNQLKNLSQGDTNYQNNKNIPIEINEHFQDVPPTIHEQVTENESREILKSTTEENNNKGNVILQIFRRKENQVDLSDDLKTSYITEDSNRKANDNKIGCPTNVNEMSNKFSTNANGSNDKETALVNNDNSQETNNLKTGNKRNRSNKNNIKCNAKENEILYYSKKSDHLDKVNSYFEKQYGLIDYYKSRNHYRVHRGGGDKQKNVNNCPKCSMKIKNAKDKLKNRKPMLNKSVLLSPGWSKVKMNLKELNIPYKKSLNIKLAVNKKENNNNNNLSNIKNSINRCVVKSNLNKMKSLSMNDLYKINNINNNRFNLNLLNAMKLSKSMNEIHNKNLHLCFKIPDITEMYDWSKLYDLKQNLNKLPNVSKSVSNNKNNLIVIPESEDEISSAVIESSQLNKNPGSFQQKELKTSFKDREVIEYRSLDIFQNSIENMKEINSRNQVNKNHGVNNLSYDLLSDEIVMNSQENVQQSNIYNFRPRNLNLHNNLKFEEKFHSVSVEATDSVDNNLRKNEENDKCIQVKISIPVLHENPRNNSEGKSSGAQRMKSNNENILKINSSDKVTNPGSKTHIQVHLQKLSNKINNCDNNQLNNNLQFYFLNPFSSNLNISIS